MGTLNSLVMVLLLILGGGLMFFLYRLFSQSGELKIKEKYLKKDLKIKKEMLNASVHSPKHLSDIIKRLRKGKF